MKSKNVPEYSSTKASFLSALAIPFLMMFLAMTARAFELIDYEVTQSEGNSKIRVAALLDSSSYYVYHVISNHEEITNLYPSVVSTKTNQSPCTKSLQLINRVRSCIAFFCIENDWAITVINSSNGQIVMETIPEISTLGSGITIWKLYSSGKKTVVMHETQLKPEFFIPPFLGEALIKDRLFREIAELLANIEIASIGLQSELSQTELERALDVVIEEIKI